VTSLQGHHQTSSPLSRHPTAVILLSFPAESQSNMAFVTEETNGHIRTSNGKVVPLPAMKAYGGRGVAPVIRILRTRWR
jgi:hypothetical protein